MTKKAFELKKQRVQIGETEEKPETIASSSKEKDKLVEKLSQRLRVANNSELTNIDLQKVLELIDKESVDLERQRQIQLKQREEEKKLVETQKIKAKKKFKKDEDLMLNRIIPYALGRDDWEDKLRKFRFSTKDQKRLYEFNNSISQQGNQNKMFESMTQSAIALPKKLPAKDHNMNSLNRRSLFKVKSHARYSYFKG